MPKEIIDYSKTVIYKIICKNLNINTIYVGSTSNFIQRKAKHKYSCNKSRNYLKAGNFQKAGNF
jgi:predicted GIY-YIG superfamily endonuclease